MHIREGSIYRNGLYRVKQITDGHHREYPYILETLDGNRRSIMAAKHEVFKPNKFFKKLYGIKE